MKDFKDMSVHVYKPKTKMKYSINKLHFNTILIFSIADEGQGPQAPGGRFKSFHFD